MFVVLANCATPDLKIGPTGCQSRGTHGNANHLLDRFDAVSGRCDDRLDELAVGILVSAIDELRDRVDTVRSLVIDAGKVERTDRIVHRPNHEEPGESSGGVFDDVAEGGGLEGSERLRGAAANVSAPGAQFVRTAREWRCRHDDDLL